MNILNLISIRDHIAFLSFAFFYQEPLKLLQKKKFFISSTKYFPRKHIVPR